MLKGGKALLVLGLLGPLFSQAPPPPPAPPAQIEWVGCGPSYNGSRVGASCGAEFDLSQALGNQGVYGWGAVDFTFYHGKTNQTVGMGMLMDARDFNFRGISIHLNLLGAPGVTTTPSATLGTMTYGIHPVLEWKKWTLGGGFRGATGGTTPRLWNISLGYSFGGK